MDVKDSLPTEPDASETVKEQVLPSNTDAMTIDALVAEPELDFEVEPDIDPAESRTPKVKPQPDPEKAPATEKLPEVDPQSTEPQKALEPTPASNASNDGSKKRKHDPIPAFQPKDRPAEPVKEVNKTSSARVPIEFKAVGERPNKSQRHNEAAGVNKGPGIAKAGPNNEQPEVASCAIRIDGFKRPLTEIATRELLSKSGNVVDMWMPTLKTHCYVIYETEAEAVASRAALNDLCWPHAESRLKPKFVSSAEATEQIAIGRGLKPPVQTRLSTEQNADEHEQRSNHGNSRSSQPTAGTINRSQTLPEKSHQASGADIKKPLTNSQVPAGNSVKAVPLVEAAVKTLDELFRKTESKPRIYWLPVSDDVVAARRIERESMPVSHPEAQREDGAKQALNGRTRSPKMAVADSHKSARERRHIQESRR